MGRKKRPAEESRRASDKSRNGRKKQTKKGSSEIEVGVKCRDRGVPTEWGQETPQLRT